MLSHRNLGMIPGSVAPSMSRDQWRSDGTQTSKDLIASIVAGAAIMAVFASFELVEKLYELTREHEDWELDEILTCIPALAIVATWFALRRWREGARLNRTLNEQARELASTLAERRAMEAQLREGYKVAAMGSLGGGFVGEFRRVLTPIGRLAEETGDRAAPAEHDGSRLERIAELVDKGLAIVNRMAAFGDGGMRDTEAIVAAEGVRESFSLARDEIDPTLDLVFRMDDEGSRIRVNRWELHEVAAQLVANAVGAMGAAGRVVVSVDRPAIDAQTATAQGLSAGTYVRVLVEDAGPGIPPDLRSHVFEPFFTTKGAGDGKGLGLAIAYSLVRGWNGNLTVLTEPEQGAILQFLIPTEDRDQG